MDKTVLEASKRDITAVTLTLPPGVRWQRSDADPVFSRVRVIYHGTPEAANELTRDSLWSLLRTFTDAKAAP